jgi:putative spermidine/putrescine transport system ATP-binding protein
VTRTARSPEARRDRDRLVNTGSKYDTSGGVPPAGREAAAMDPVSPPTTPIVQFADVQKTYDGSTLVVKNLNLSVRRGEFLTFLGPSGSVKTTTLMMLAGFELPTHGEIFLDGASISTLPPHKRGIGMVFQSYALFPHMSVAQNVAFPLEVRRVPKAEITLRVRRALQMVDMDGFASRRPHQLSGGQQQRIALARALVFEPRLVLMDEPLGALDKQLREQMQYELKQLHRKLGVTIIYVTHDQAEALTMSDRIAVFRDGAIDQLATPAELYERPRTPYVAQFIGENNRLLGTLTRAAAHGQCIVSLDDGFLVAATAIVPLGLGDRCLVSVRPERIAIGGAARGENQFEGHVEGAVYLGDHLRLQVSVGTARLIVKTPNTDGSPGVLVGQRLATSWHARDCQAFPLEPHETRSVTPPEVR